MSKGKALLETLIISVVVPCVMWLVTFFNSNWLFFARPIIIAVFIIVGLVYTHVVYTRHKDLGKLFVSLTAFLSILLQYVVFIFLLVFMVQSSDASDAEGHPNGDAILLLLILFMEPLVINLFPMFTRFIKAIIGLFTKE